ncbi:MAG: hypothetical protein RBT11_18920 [Desulfobacterales bacterium]|jgi:hypothetical protein|nr:hypothetical protein [Desulfobacterales bacterium]
MSKALRNVLTSIAMCEAMVKSIAEDYRSRSRNKTVLGLTARIVDSTQAAMRAWPGELDGKAIKKISERLGRFEKIYGKVNEVVFMTSTSLGILEDILPHIKDQEKCAAIEKLIYAINRLHVYFDRSLNKIPVYQRAGEAVKTWRMLEA